MNATTLAFLMPVALGVMGIAVGLRELSKVKKLAASTPALAEQPTATNSLFASLEPVDVEVVHVARGYKIGSLQKGHYSKKIKQAPIVIHRWFVATPMRPTVSLADREAQRK